jgi:hypothetical protein
MDTDIAARADSAPATERGSLWHWVDADDLWSRLVSPTGSTPSSGR